MDEQGEPREGETPCHIVNDIHLAHVKPWFQRLERHIGLQDYRFALLSRDFVGYQRLGLVDLYATLKKLDAGHYTHAIPRRLGWSFG